MRENCQKQSKTNSLVMSCSFDHALIQVTKMQSQLLNCMWTLAATPKHGQVHTCRCFTAGPTQGVPRQIQLGEAAARTGLPWPAKKNAVFPQKNMPRWGPGIKPNPVPWMFNTTAIPIALALGTKKSTVKLHFTTAVKVQLHPRCRQLALGSASEVSFFCLSASPKDGFLFSGFLCFKEI